MHNNMLKNYVCAIFFFSPIAQKIVSEASMTPIDVDLVTAYTTDIALHYFCGYPWKRSKITYQVGKKEIHNVM